LILDPESRRVRGSSNCNRLTGSYELSGDRLTFGQMAGTMMACEEGMDIQKIFLKAFAQAKTWKGEGERLELFDADGHSVATLEAPHVK